jgi:hypothetical protein
VVFYHALASFQIAELLHQRQTAEAIARLAPIFAVVRCLAAQRHVEARLSAAQLRRQSLLVLEAIVQSPDVRTAELTAVLDMLERELAVWPSDAEAWIGDRAMTLHAYELLRIGHFEMVMTPTEIETLDDEGIMPYFTRAVARTIDDDELYYLSAMRDVIANCSRPYFGRKESLTALAKDLDERRGGADYPLAAARLFLPEVDSAQKLQAEDRARCEAWALALAAALGIAAGDHRVNPATGEEFEVVVSDGRAAVAAHVAQDRTIVVPQPRRDVANQRK